MPSGLASRARLDGDFLHYPISYVLATRFGWQPYPSVSSSSVTMNFGVTGFEIGTGLGGRRNSFINTLHDYLMTKNYSTNYLAYSCRYA